MLNLAQPLDAQLLRAHLHLKQSPVEVDPDERRKELEPTDEVRTRRDERQFVRVAGPEPKTQPKASSSLLFVLEDCLECSETEKRDAQAEEAFGLLLEVVEDLEDGHADEMDVGLVHRDDGNWEREEVNVDGAVVCVQRREHGGRAWGR